MKNNNLVIYLWRGKNQNLLDYRTAHDLIMDSKFRKASEVKQKKQSMLITLG